MLKLFNKKEEHSCDRHIYIKSPPELINIGALKEGDYYINKPQTSRFNTVISNEIDSDFVVAQEYNGQTILVPKDELVYVNIEIIKKYNK